MRLLSLFVLTVFLTFSWNAISDSTSFSNPLVDAADNGDIDEVRRLLKSGIKPDSEGEFGVTPLMRAAFKGNVEIAELLIKSGAYVNASDIGGDTALHMAARSGNPRMVKMLLHYDATIDAVDNQQWTPLMRAIMAKSPDVTQILVDKGADLNLKNNAGNSSLAQAAISGKKSVLKVLLSSDSFKNVSYEQKQASIAISKKRGDFDLSEMIASTVDYYGTDTKQVANTEDKQELVFEDDSDKKVASQSNVWEDKELPLVTNLSPYIDNNTDNPINSPYTQPVYTPKMKPNYSGSDVQTVPAEFFANKYTIQIGAFSEKGQANFIWNSLSSKHGEILAGLVPTILKVNDNKGAVFYRLRVGAYSNKPSAARKCNEMQQRRIDCFVVRSSKGQVPMDGAQNVKYQKPVHNEVERYEVPSQNYEDSVNKKPEVNYFSITPRRGRYIPPSAPVNRQRVQERPVPQEQEMDSGGSAPIDTMPLMSPYGTNPNEINYTPDNPRGYLYKNGNEGEQKVRDGDNYVKYEPMNKSFVGQYEGYQSKSNNYDRNFYKQIRNSSREIYSNSSQSKSVHQVQDIQQSDLPWLNQSVYDEQDYSNEVVGNDEFTNYQNDNIESQQNSQVYGKGFDDNQAVQYAQNTQHDQSWMNRKAQNERVQSNEMVRREDFAYSPSSNVQKQHDYNSFYENVQRQSNGYNKISEAVLVKESHKMPWLRQDNGSSMKEESGIWLEIYPFPNRVTANDYADRMFKYDEDMKDLQVLLLGGDTPYDRKIRLRVGPIQSYGRANMLCNNIMSSGLKCFATGKPDQQNVVDISAAPQDPVKKVSIPRVKKLSNPEVKDENDPYWINLGAFSNNYKAEYYLMYLQEDHEDILRGVQFNIDDVNESSRRGKSNAVKLKLGPYYDKFKADSMCHAMRRRNISCLVIK